MGWQVENQIRLFTQVAPTLVHRGQKEYIITIKRLLTLVWRPHQVAQACVGFICGEQQSRWQIIRVGIRIVHGGRIVFVIVFVIFVVIEMFQFNCSLVSWCVLKNELRRINIDQLCFNLKSFISYARSLIRLWWRLEFTIIHKYINIIH